MAEYLDALKSGGWGYLYPQPPIWSLVRDSVVWRTGQSGAPVASPGRWVPTVGASDNGASGQSGGAPDRSYSLSGASSGACSDFCACRHALFTFTIPLQMTVGAK
jgi:hypothetical protein